MTTRHLVLAGMFTALAGIAAVIVRFSGAAMVPFSLLPLIVFIAALILPPKAAAMSFTAYLLLGLTGMPVFASPPYGGLSYVLKPTFGFILAFPIAAALISAMTRKTRKPLALAAALVSGIAVIYIIGALYLFIVVNYYMGSTMPVGQVMKVAVLPFIGFDLIKAGAAIALIGIMVKRLPTLLD